MTYGHLGLIACTPGSAPGLTLGIEYGKLLPLPFYGRITYAYLTYVRLNTITRAVRTFELW